MKRREGSDRKVRNDKKICVQPMMSLELKKQLFRFSFLCGSPMKDAAEKLCTEGSTDSLILDEVCQFFRRNLSMRNHHYVGYLDRPRVNLLQNKAEKVTIKFTQSNYEPVYNLAYALDLPLNQTATILIKKTLNNREFMDTYIRSNLKYLHEQDKNQIRKFLQTVWGFK